MYFYQSYIYMLCLVVFTFKVEQCSESLQQIQQYRLKA